MTSKQTPEALPAEYGFGWGTGGGGYGHGGAFKTDMHIDPKLGLITVYMVQQAGWCNDETGNQVKAAFQKEATRSRAMTASAGPWPYPEGRVVILDQFRAPAANLKGQEPARGTGVWHVTTHGDSSISTDGSRAFVRVNGGTPGSGTVMASLPFAPAADTLYVLRACYSFNEPVNADAWMGTGFCDGAGRKGPWMLVRPPKSEVADGQAVGFTGGDLRTACHGTVYAPLYPDVTAALVWSTRTQEVRYYVNNILQGSLKLSENGGMERVFLQGFQTGAAVTVREVRLTAQTAP